jgi:hypothetical protein
VQQAYWINQFGRSADYEFDPNKSYDPNGDAAIGILSEFLGPIAGYIDPVLLDALLRRDREWLVKAVINGVEYDNTVIVDFDIEYGITSEEEFELGTANLSKLTIRLRTRDIIPSNAKIVPYVALSLANMTWNDANYTWDEADWTWEGGKTEWLPLGEFFVDKRERINDVWEFVCYDKLMFANAAYVSQLTYPATMQAVWDEICGRLGFTYDSSVVINPTYSIPAGPAGYTCKQVMAFIAGANGASVYAGRDGVIRFKRFTAEDTPVFEMTEADYIRVKQTNPTKTYTRLVVTYDTEDQLTYEAGTGDENHTLYLTNPLMTQQMVNNLLAQIDGFTYVPIEMDARGYPHLGVGDRISYERSESLTWLEASMSWNEADFRWDGIQTYQTLILRQTFTFKGGLGMSLAAPSKSEQESEFPVKGTLTEAVERLNQNAVKYGKPYYGVTHSRAEGIVVQREDGKAKAVFNADELSFWADGQRALWFDVPNLRWKFTGTLEGVDGTFSGTIQGGQFVGGSITIGSGNNVFRADTQGIWAGNANFNSAPFRVDMSGQLVANNAQITGTITGSTIQGSFIFGTAITGGSISIGNGQFNVDSSGFMTATGAHLSGGSLTGAAIINVTNEVKIGKKLILPASDVYNGIYWGTGSTFDAYQIYIDILTGAMHLIAPNGIYANGNRIDV